MSDAINERYRLDRELVRTEAGIVYEARDLELQRSVAVEVASSIVEPAARKRWTRDAIVAQRLAGEHVLRVLEVGDRDGVPFVVREASLRTLSTELDERGTIPIPQAVAWTLEACEAVAEAHALGIAHGDLRLENIHLVRATPESKVKVAWTSAAKAERAAREDVARDIASLGVMVRLLATGRVLDQEEDGAPTLPNGLAHAVARALAEEPSGGFMNVAELARTLAPFAPPNHPSAGNVARILSRAGIVSSAIPTATVERETTPDAPQARLADRDRASFTDEWFGRDALAAQLEPPRNRHARAFALVSMALVAMVLAGTWFLWQRGTLPRWTGAAPPEAVDTSSTTEVTSGPASPENQAVDLANSAATDPMIKQPPAVTTSAPPKPAPVPASTAPAPAYTAPAYTAPAYTAPATTTPPASTTSSPPSSPEAPPAPSESSDPTPSSEPPAAPADTQATTPRPLPGSGY